MHDSFNLLAPFFIKGREIDLDNIHTDPASPPDTPCVRPSCCFQIALLCEIHSGRGRTVGGRHESALRTRFYFADDERSAAAGNDIDLLAVEKPIAFQNAVKPAPKITDGRPLSENAAAARFGLDLLHLSRNFKKLLL